MPQSLHFKIKTIAGVSWFLPFALLLSYAMGNNENNSSAAKKSCNKKLTQSVYIIKYWAIHLIILLVRNNYLLWVT